MSLRTTILRIVASPIGWVYALGVWIRNRLYDQGMIKSRVYDIPVLSVGNITAGGTGKTPHVEYLLHLLEKHWNVAMVSRGYKRKSRGFQEAGEHSDCFQLGDEPYQIYRKHKHDVHVVVDKDRCHAIDCLRALHPDLQVVVLDDAYQYRKIQPGLSILLMDYNRMVEDDRLLPFGMLREPASAKERADVLVVTKCPPTLNPFEARQLYKKIQPRPYQKVFYSTFKYGQLRGVFHTADKLSSAYLSENNTSILICTAIAQPSVLEEHVRKLSKHVEGLYYRDHHYMSSRDMAQLQERFDALPGTSKIIVVTDKDAAKLYHNPHIPEELKDKLYCMPLKVEFLLTEEGSFDKIVKDYVAENC